MKRIATAFLTAATCAVLATVLCAPASILAQTSPRVPSRSFVPLDCEGGVRTRMNVIHMGTDSLVMLYFEGKWLDLRQVAEPQAGVWIFQDKAAELRWSMKQREGILERADSVLARCTTALPVEVIMMPSTGSQ